MKKNITFLGLTSYGVPFAQTSNVVVKTTMPYFNCNTAVLKFRSTDKYTRKKLQTLINFFVICLFLSVGTAIVKAQDSDGDGIVNISDLDDDNDGILDSNECPTTYIVRPINTASITNTGTITSGSASVIANGEGAGGSGEGVGNWYTNTSNLPLTFNMNLQSSSTIDNIKLWGPWGFDEWIKQFRVNLYNSSGTLLGTENLTAPDKYTANGNLYTIIPFSQEYTGVTRISFTVISGQGYNAFGRVSCNEIVLLDLQICDFDNDGIPNQLDLDSDNDGCVDALEGSASITTSQLVNAGGSITVGPGSSASNKNLCASSSCVDANGVPLIVGSSGQGAGTSTNSSIQDTQCLTGFGCTTNLYLSQTNILYNVGTSTNPFTYTQIGTPAATNYNAIGINPLDGFMYGMLVNSNTIIRINADGTYNTLGAVTGLPGAVTYNSGEIDNLGNYYVKVGTSNNQIYRINLNTLTATLITITSNITLPDMAYSVITGRLYGVNSTNGQLVSVNPTTGTVTPIGIAPGSGTFGAMFASSTGELYGVENAGGFYQFDLTTGQRVLISNAPASGGNDGAHCVTSPITFSADLYVTKTDGTPNYTPGATTTYTIVAGNNGPFGVLNANVSDSVPAGIPAANVTYTAVASSGSSTSVTGTQTGAINDLVSLPVGGKVTYTVSIVIPAGFTGDLTNVVTITAPAAASDPVSANNTATDTDMALCYKPATTAGTALDTKHGITALGRAGVDMGNWPMVRKGAWTALESKTKGFVVNRISTTAQVTAIANPVEGMMVYDEEADCLKIYTTTDNGVTFSWQCFNTQTCPN